MANVNELENNIAKIPILPQMIYRSNAFHIKILTFFFCKNRKIHLKILKWNFKDSGIAKTILKIKNKVGKHIS